MAKKSTAAKTAARNTSPAPISIDASQTRQIEELVEGTAFSRDTLARRVVEFGLARVDEIIGSSAGHPAARNTSTAAVEHGGQPATRSVPDTPPQAASLLEAAAKLEGELSAAIAQAEQASPVTGVIGEWRDNLVSIAERATTIAKACNETGDLVMSKRLLDTSNQALATVRRLLSAISQDEKPAVGINAEKTAKSEKFARKDAREAKWGVRNFELDIAGANSSKPEKMDIMTALTPANGKWILREVEGMLRARGLYITPTQLLFMLDRSFPVEVFKRKRTLRKALADHLDEDQRAGGFMSTRSHMLASYVDGCFGGDLKRSGPLSIGETFYRDSEDTVEEGLATSRLQHPAT